MKRTTILEIIIFLYSILFLYTGISKLIEYDIFKENIKESPFLSPVAKPISLGLPWLEFIITLMLIIPRWRSKGLYASLILMTLFTLYVIGILMFDKHLPCSCGGIIQSLSWHQHLIFNGIFIMLAIWGIALNKKEKKTFQTSWPFSNYKLLKH